MTIIAARKGGGNEEETAPRLDRGKLSQLEIESGALQGSRDDDIAEHSQQTGKVSNYDAADFVRIRKTSRGTFSVLIVACASLIGVCYFVSHGTLWPAPTVDFDACLKTSTRVGRVKEYTCWQTTAQSYVVGAVTQTFRPVVDGYADVEFSVQENGRISNAVIKQTSFDVADRTIVLQALPVQTIPPLAWMKKPVRVGVLIRYLAPLEASRGSGDGEFHCDDASLSTGGSSDVRSIERDRCRRNQAAVRAIDGAPPSR